jgi:hypothetical protein
MRTLMLALGATPLVGVPALIALGPVLIWTRVEKVLRTAVRGPDGVGAPADPGRRTPVERTDQVVSRHPGQRVPDKTDRTSVGLFATGPTSGTSGAGRPCAGVS